MNAVRENNDVLSAGLVEQNHELYLALVTGRVHDLATLSRISIPIPDGPPATLAELGQLSVDDEVSYVRTTANGKPAVLLNIIRQPTANTVAIERDIRQLLHDHPRLLPSGVSWTSFYDQARFVSDSVTGTKSAILIGVLLAAVVLFAFLRRWRSTLVASAAIPITVAIMGITLGAAHQTLNLMTLAGIAAALGLIADDAIVVLEDIERHRDAGHADPVGTSLRELMPALIGSSVATVIIFVPFSLLPGITGAFFKPLALTMALALTISFFIAAVAAPMGLQVLERGNAPSLPSLSPADSKRENRESDPKRGLGRGLDRSYSQVAGLFIEHGWVAAFSLVVLLTGAVLLYRHIGTDFLPAMDEGSIILDYWTPPGTSLTDTDKMLQEVEKVILSTPDVESYSRRTGTQLGFFITEPNAGDYVINLKSHGHRRALDEVANDLRDRIAQVEPAVHTDFGQILEDDIGDLTGGEPQPIDIKIFGEDPSLLESKAKQIAKIVADVRGVEDTFDGIVVAGPALEIRVKPEAAARYGITTQDLHAEVEPAILGTVAGQIQVGDRMHDVRVLLPHEGILDDLRIRAGTALLPLREVATIRTGLPETEIDRENLKTYVGVTARISGRDLGSTVAEIRRRIDREVELGVGMSIRYGGQYEQQQQSFRDLLYLMLAGLVLVSLVILFAFGDWRAPLVASLAAVASLAGALGALALTGQTLNISSYVGAIMMVGLVGDNVMFAINEAKLGLEEGLSSKVAWHRVARRRLRPMAMTIFATGFALAPLALALGQGAQLIQPLAIAVIGGFTLSGPIVLFLLPGCTGGWIRTGNWAKQPGQPELNAGTKRRNFVSAEQLAQNPLPVDPHDSPAVLGTEPSVLVRSDGGGKALAERGQSVFVGKRAQEGGSCLGVVQRCRCHRTHHHPQQFESSLGVAAQRDRHSRVGKVERIARAQLHVARQQRLALRRNLDRRDDLVPLLGVAPDAVQVRAVVHGVRRARGQKELLQRDSPLTLGSHQMHARVQGPQHRAQIAAVSGIANRGVWYHAAFLGLCLQTRTQSAAKFRSLVEPVAARIHQQVPPHRGRLADERARDLAHGLGDHGVGGGDRRVARKLAQVDSPADAGGRQLLELCDMGETDDFLFGIQLVLVVAEKVGAASEEIEVLKFLGQSQSFLQGLGPMEPKARNVHGHELRIPLGYLREATPFLSLELLALASRASRTRSGVNGNLRRRMPTAS